MTAPTTSTMTIERLRRFSAAWSTADVDRLMSFVTDDCVYYATVGPEPGSTYRGKERSPAGIHRSPSIRRGP